MEVGELIKEIILVIATSVAGYFFGVKKTKDEIKLQEASQIKDPRPKGRGIRRREGEQFS